MSYVSEVLEQINERHSKQPEYTQAVTEVLRDVSGLVSQNEKALRRQAILERLVEPDRLLRFRVNWERDDGSLATNLLWRVQFNNALGAYKGGLRFHPSVNTSILKFLGFEQTFKNALTGLPMGGAKGGSNFNPKEASLPEIRRFCQQAMLALHPFIGPDADVPAGDIGVGSREIAFLYGQYLQIHKAHRGVLTGKQPSFGGSCGRTEATGYGVIFFLEEALAAREDTLEGKSLLISGAGNVALHTAEKALQEGARVLSLSDSRGLVVFKDGLTQDQLRSLKTARSDKRQSLAEWHSEAADSGCDYQDGNTPWHLEADIAIPCATQNEIDEDAAKHLVEGGIQWLIEGANMPLTSAAQEQIRDAGITYIPGKIANAGGVAVSGFERSQQAALLPWTLDTVTSRLKDLMKRIHRNVSEAAPDAKGPIDYRVGANRAAFDKVVNVMQAYGI